MPLSVYKRDEAGNVLFKDGANLIPQTQQVELLHEMSDTDFEPVRYDWLHTAFKQKILWHTETDECRHELGRLGVFLNEKSVGPYYVYEESVNNRTTYSLVLLEPEDIEAFKLEFPEWKFNPYENARNMSTMRLGLQQGWRPQNERLKDFCFKNGLCASTAPAVREP